MVTATQIYTCSVGGYDWVHSPVAPTPGTLFTRFSDRARARQHPWIHNDLPDNLPVATPRLICRYAKILPHRLLPDSALTVWVDSSVQILTDITPLLETFDRSGADIALFPHPSGRSTEEELDFALRVGRVEAADRAAAQRTRYAEAGVLDSPIYETTIVFRRTHSPRVKASMERWWHEVSHFTERDQVSLAYAMLGQSCRVFEWDWHFDDPGCPWFRRMPHRPPRIEQRLMTGSHFLADYRLEYRILRSGFGLVAAGRKALGLPRLYPFFARFGSRLRAFFAGKGTGR